MNHLIAYLMSGPLSVVQLASLCSVSQTTIKAWLKYLISAGIAECSSTGFRLRVDPESFTPEGPRRLVELALALKHLKYRPAGDFISPVLVTNLMAAGVIDPDTKMLATKIAPRPKQPPWAERLTPVQMETLRILARTGSTKAVAIERNLSPHSINSMLKDIYIRMGVHSSTTAAYMIGLLDGAST
jgi:DNA-binding CsgD family transcriptional regulator